MKAQGCLVYLPTFWFDGDCRSTTIYWVFGIATSSFFFRNNDIRYLRESLASIGFTINDGVMTSDGKNALSKLADTFFGTLTSFISRGQRSKPKVGHPVPILAPTQDYQLLKGRHDSRKFWLRGDGVSDRVLSSSSCDHLWVANMGGLSIWDPSNSLPVWRYSLFPPAAAYYGIPNWQLWPDLQGRSLEQ